MCVQWGGGGEFHLITLSHNFTNCLFIGEWRAEHRARWGFEAWAFIYYSFLVKLNKKIPFARREGWVSGGVGGFHLHHRRNGGNKDWLSLFLHLSACLFNTKQWDSSANYAIHNFNYFVKLYIFRKKIIDTLQANTIYKFKHILTDVKQISRRVYQLVQSIFSIKCPLQVVSETRSLLVVTTDV